MPHPVHQKSAFQPRPVDRDTEKPTLDVVRRMTDAHVLTQLMTDEMLTRSQIAARTGISKPTISESIKRLSIAGRVVESGRQTDGSRGRTGTYCRLADEIGVAVAMHAGPEGVLVDVSDLRGTTIYEAQQPVDSPITPRRLGSVIERVARSAKSSVQAPPLAISMSIADPVNQKSGRITSLPNSPFLIGELRPHSVLARVGFELDCVVIDNDTNFGALAEHRQGNAQDLEDFGYLWLGAGIGLGLIINGRLHRGWTGLAGEIWQTITRGPNGQAIGLVECFTELGLTGPGTSAIDVGRISAILASSDARDDPTRNIIVNAVSTALANATALINPQAVVVAGPWSDYGSIRSRLADSMREAAVPTEIRTPQIDGNPFLAGARIDALDRARRRVLEAPLT
jgi:predicted NBD/HSP70 family sugar kinase/biotin operon repressor